VRNGNVKHIINILDNCITKQAFGIRIEMCPVNSINKKKLREDPSNGILLSQIKVLLFAISFFGRQVLVGRVKSSFQSTDAG